MFILLVSPILIQIFFQAIDGAQTTLSIYSQPRIHCCSQGAYRIYNVDEIQIKGRTTGDLFVTAAPARLVSTGLIQVLSRTSYRMGSLPVDHLKSPLEPELRRTEQTMMRAARFLPRLAPMDTMYCKRAVRDQVVVVAR